MMIRKDIPIVVITEFIMSCAKMTDDGSEGVALYLLKIPFSRYSQSVSGIFIKPVTDITIPE